MWSLIKINIFYFLKPLKYLLIFFVVEFFSTIKYILYIFLYNLCYLNVSSLVIRKKSRNKSFNLSRIPYNIEHIKFFF